ELKKEFTQQWLENRDYLYWYNGKEEDNLYDMQRFLKGFFKVDLDAKKNKVTIDQKTRYSLSEEEKRQLLRDRKFWQEVVFEREKMLSLDFLITALKNPAYAQERFSILNEALEKHPDKKLIPVMIELIDSKSGFEYEEPKNMTGGSTNELVITTLEKWLGIKCGSEESSDIESFKRKCRNFWNKNRYHLEWDSKEECFVVR
ncbi:MAG: hypothetical protein ABIH42_09565, partial [Planctomycetota bacterium]